MQLFSSQPLSFYKGDISSLPWRSWGGFYGCTVSTLTCVGNGTEVGRPGVQFGKVATSQELTSADIFSFQFCSQKAVTENKSHCFLLCLIENVARHLHVGGRESSQVVQAASPGWAGALCVLPSKRGASLIPFLTLASLQKVSSLWGFGSWVAATHNHSWRGLVISGLNSSDLHSPGVCVIGVVVFITLLLRIFWHRG